MKRLDNVYPVDIDGREAFVTFDHFTNNGQPVYNVEFLAATPSNVSYMVRYKGIKAANRNEAARIAITQEV